MTKLNLRISTVLRAAMLAIVAVVTSLYPASTVVLAQLFLHERLSAWQWLGLALAAGSVVLIGI